MIQLHNDYLLFKTTSGETIPCSVERVTLELVGEAASQLNPDLVRQAAAAVLHYFKNDLGLTAVSVADFSVALERVLTTLGLKVKSDDGYSENAEKVEVSDLRTLVTGPDKAFELAFFPKLRDELRNMLRSSPQVLSFRGLRGCVKQLLGVKRWNKQCQALNDQIVEFLRECFSSEEQAASCGLLIQ